MIKVTRNRGEDFEEMLRRFKTACRREGVISGIRDRRAYEKPSDRRRRKHFKATLINRKKHDYKQSRR